MMKHLAGIFDSNWFFLALVGFVIALPLSPALVSIFAGVILLTALVEDTIKNKLQRLKARKVLLFIPAVFFIYAISSLLTLNGNNPFYDLKKTLFFLVIPLAFAVGKPIGENQKRILFYVFSGAIIVSTFVAIVNWSIKSSGAGFGVHDVSLVSHIRFSFQLILAFWFYVLISYKNYKQLKIKILWLFLGLAFYFLVFLLFQQSLTGLIAIVTSGVFFLLYLAYSAQYKLRYQILAIALLFIVIPVTYVGFVVNRFYQIESIDREGIDKKTPDGNYYYHNFENPMVENGRYVHLYVCDMELREEWNKLSEYKYDSIGLNGYPIHATLKRYLTSMDVRKDAEGMKALKQRDIKNIENGMANVIFQKKYSIYPRIYQTVWEFYVYTNTGYADHQSLSQRIEFARAAMAIIKDNFWFGVGTGNWKEEFAKSFQRIGSKLDKSLYASSHNQYLNYMVKFGFAGFLVIIFFFAYPVADTKSYKDPLFLTFLVYMFFANFADSNFESHMGSSFFLFFYSLFIASSGSGYLNLTKE